MRNNIICITISFVISLVFSHIAVGSNSSDITYSVKDGLSNNTVKAICRDEKGYVWIGTKNGLNRLDGYGITNYYHQPSRDSKQPNDIVSIDRLSDGLLWIGTFSGIVLFNPDNESYIDIRSRYEGSKYPRSVVTGLHETSEGDIYVATKQGLFLFSKEGKCSELTEFEDSYIHSLTPVSDYRILIDIVDSGLCEYYTSTHNLRNLLPNTSGFTVMKGLKHGTGDIWLAKDLRHLYRYNPTTGSLDKLRCTYSPEVRIDNNFVHDLARSDSNTILMATDYGLIRLDTGSMHLSAESGIDSSRRLMSVVRDEQDNIWVGTFGQGAVCHTPVKNAFTHHTLSPDPTKTISVVGRMGMSEGKLWIGHTGGLLTLDTSSPNAEVNNIPLSAMLPATDPELYHMSPQPDGSILLYFLNSGIYRYDPAGKRLERCLSSLSGDEQVRAIATDAQGQIWVAADDLAFVNDSTGMIDKNLSTNFSGITRYMLTQDILPYRDDMIVGARTNGVLIFHRNPDSPEHYFKGDHPEIPYLKDINVCVLYEDSKENIWVGTYDSGLYRWNPKAADVKRFDTSDGLVHNSICAIQEDADGDIWVAAVNGLSRIKPDGSIINFTRENGFPLDENSAKAIILADNGHLFIGGNNGIAELDPSLLYTSSKSTPLVAISMLETLNPPDSPNYIHLSHPADNKSIELPYNNSSIRIRFSTLDFSNPKGYKFAYRLKGLGEEWLSTELNEVTYTNLQPGDYTFEVKARDYEGNWSESPTAFSFEVSSAPWATWWAKTLYAIFIIGFIILIMRYFQQRKTMKHKQEIERIEKENIRKNYQMRIELFTNFSHELRTPLTLISGPLNDLIADRRLPASLHPTVRQIQKSSNRLMLLVNQLLDFRKFEHGAMQLQLSRINTATFIKEQIGNFHLLLEKHDITLTYNNSYHRDDIWADADLLSKVVFNLLSNAIKHSPDGSTIEITTAPTADNTGLDISIFDHGEGVRDQDKTRIFDPFYQVGSNNKKEMFGSGIGLSLVQYIVNLHKGRVWEDGKYGCGAVFHVVIPSGKEHFEQANVTYINEPDDSRSLADRTLSDIGDTPAASERVYIEGRPNILVVEDDEDLRAYICNKINAKMNVKAATNGKEALEMARQEMPDLIVSDVVMPVMDGIELCQAVKSDMSLAHIPVILLTARTLEEHISEGYQALADDYVLKPFNHNILKAKIESLLKNRARLRALFSEKLQATEIPVEEIKEENPFMKRIIELINGQAHDPDLSVEYLYTEMGMSRTQFFRKIKALSDLSPNKLILNIRMKMAVEKFKAGGKNISEVAYEVGFSDPAYFSKVFKSVFGITPTEYMAEQH